MSVFMAKVPALPILRSVLLCIYSFPLLFIPCFIWGPETAYTSFNNHKFTLNNIMSFSLDINKSDIF